MWGNFVRRVGRNSGRRTRRERRWTESTPWNDLQASRNDFVSEFEGSLERMMARMSEGRWERIGGGFIRK